MKRNSGIILTLYLGLLLSAPLMGAQPKTQSGMANAQTFSGEIMDSLCAKDGTHEKMMAEMKNMGRDKNSCATMCARLGSKYVLYDGSKKAIYSLDDQGKAEAFAGQTVRVLGTLEKSKIKIESIEAVGAQAQGRP
ncbi:MAG: hypothetical protein ABR955_16660 [Verrucomicrobiota bacterium]|jgi:hypothetical protein